MRGITSSYTGIDIISSESIDQRVQQIQPEIGTMRGARMQEYDTPYASINVLDDSHSLDNIKDIVRCKQALSPTIMVIIGIGGSNLGTLAVHHALHGTLYNETTAGMRLYFVDSVDTVYTATVYCLVEQELQKNKRVLINIISKSGSTTETVANAQIFIDCLKRYQPDVYHDGVVITTDVGSQLWDIALKENFTCLSIPQQVGGRYSVLSPAGLFPLGMIGVDLQQLCAGARAMRDMCLSQDDTKNPAARRAAILYELYSKGYVIHDMFLFHASLESVGKWYRQLMGESIGKEYDRKGYKVHIGITPIVSIGSVDLHSMVQLYLSGPYVTSTTFVSVQDNAQEMRIPVNKTYRHLVADIQGKPLSVIMDAILQGTQHAFKEKNRPFMSLVLPELSEYYIGQLLQMHMMEMIYLGYLLNVNPFDQPNVEEYKQETRELLKQKI